MRAECEEGESDVESLADTLMPIESCWSGMEAEAEAEAEGTALELHQMRKAGSRAWVQANTAFLLLQKKKNPFIS